MPFPGIGPDELIQSIALSIGCQKMGYTSRSCACIIDDRTIEQQSIEQPVV